MKNLLTAFCLLAVFSAPAQTLFTYGNEAVSAEDFLRAFKKNNNGAKDEKALKEYLDLYIASRLKIKEAKDQRFDTLPQLVADLANLREQILPNYINDKAGLERLVDEALVRSQKDIHVAHIFISFQKGGSHDTAVAFKRRTEVMQKLSNGAKFENLAKQYSDDPSAQINGGDMGWITVFTLPYELENIIYATPAGKISSVYTSRAGYHIFKNIGERKALGRMKAAQILLAFPPGANQALKLRLKKTADSLYNRLQAGEDFGKLATAFSNDVVSAASNGQMSEFGVGEFDPAFERLSFALQKNGAFTKPFMTAYGYHIVKRIQHLPVTAKASDDVKDDLRRKIESSDRILTIKKALAQKILKENGYQKLLQPGTELWAYSDSVFNLAQPKAPLTIGASTPVLKLGDRIATAQDWVEFARAFRQQPGGTGAKLYTQLWDDFTEATALQYYQDNLENYNEEFRRQVTEFAEGNLFFEIMQRKVWTPAQADTVALLDYYQKNKAQYVWKQSADAVIFYAADEKAANDFYKALQKTPGDWKIIAANYSEQITADSGRFELEQIPKGEKEQLKKNSVTTPLLNKADNTVSFAYIIKLYTEKEPRNFNDARGLVINDYQAELEKAWVAELKKAYPVVVNKSVLKELQNRIGD